MTPPKQPTYYDFINTNNSNSPNDESSTTGSSNVKDATTGKATKTNLSDLNNINIQTYKQIKQKSDQSFKNISLNLKQIVQNNDNETDNNYYPNEGKPSSSGKDNGTSSKGSSQQQQQQQQHQKIQQSRLQQLHQADNVENESLVKIKQIHKNAAIIKQQQASLINKDFKPFLRKLQQFNRFINTHFDISSNVLDNSRSAIINAGKFESNNNKDALQLSGNSYHYNNDNYTRSIRANSIRHMVNNTDTDIDSYNTWQNNNGGKFKKSKGEGNSGSNGTTTKELVKTIKQNDKISRKISHIQFFAEKIDQKIRILELAKRTITSNLTL